MLEHLEATIGLCLLVRVAGRARR